MPPHDKPGRRPIGQRALTGAERQARYRARHAAVPVIRYPRGSSPRAKGPRPADRRSRVQRWQAAVAELLALQSEYADWLAAMPEATRNGATGEALQAIVDLDLDELSNIEPPRGFGRD
jgi:hypothetical protein